MSISGKEFWEGRERAVRERARQARSGGPVFGNAPLVWWDQLFGRELTPGGTLEPETALRVGNSGNALDVIVVASHANTEDLTVSAGCKLTLDLLHADTPDGPFAETGPSICITAPDTGLTIPPDALVARFALGNMHKAWAKVRLTTDGLLSGGTIDIALAYAAR